ncbi:site-specific DNA-methyltransferase (adenine-specific) [Neisseria perflava]|uniref:DNA-methyltransferase n=1 Tax=Neisseria perflava TaxID=33053 RepID=UPI0020A100F7|nr:site-specific DNA-methyltransferase [Neisseria perflava]MCP1772054.1 site-specific DNA-methyltransferase (adenine-specific) [Neisseria perflava]
MSNAFNTLKESVASYGNSLHKFVANGMVLYRADSLVLMRRILDKYPNGCFDMIFVDPPYFLSNGGFSCQNGQMVSVDKGAWDKSRGLAADMEFYEEWLSLCYALLKPNGTIWVCGTFHNIYLIGYLMQTLGYHILNNITWEKPNPPPNLSCRFFTHSTETLLWAKKNKKAKHTFHYQLMKETNHNKQMKSVWQFTPPLSSEKLLGKHPTQKPLSLVERCILAASNPADLVFDPFMGSGTTGATAIKHQRYFCGCDINDGYFELAKRRLLDIEKNTGNNHV